MGQFCTPVMQKDRPMLHWEIFAGDNLKGFIGRARDANKTAKKLEKTVIKIPKGTTLNSPNPQDVNASLAGNTIIKVLKKQGDYIQCQTIGMSAKVNKKTQLHYIGVKAGVSTYKILKSAITAVSALLGQTLTETSEVKLLAKHEGDDRTILLPQRAEILWIKKTTGLKKRGDKQQVKTNTDAWTTYPENFNTELATVEEGFCMTLSEMKIKKQDETGNDWFEIMLTQNRICTQGYIDSSKLSYHAPEEFICFNGSDAKGGSDASIHKDADTYWKNLLTPITLDNAENEDANPDSNFRLALHPFATEVFKHMDENHDGTITLAEVQQAQKDPIKQKKIAQLITSHESEWVGSMDRWKYVEKYMPDATRFDWEHEKARIKKLAWWDEVKRAKVTGFPEAEAYYFHPAGFVGNLLNQCSDCGKKHLKQIRCTRYKGKYGTYYGPIYKGLNPLNTYSRWNELISSGAISLDEKKILIAMSANEGNLDSVQSYDSEIFTAGAMQKTINSIGQGELPIQMNKFKERHPDLFQKYFKCCGWDVHKVSNKYTAYYKSKTGKELKAIIRKGFTSSTYGEKVKNSATAAFIEAISSNEYQDIQLEDFTDRLNNIALKINPRNYTYIISDYVKSNLGKATVLDHHINRPAQVAKYFGRALNVFFASHPTVSKKPSDWGNNHTAYEKIIIDYYGVHRSGTDMINRYNKMKAKL